MSILFAGGRGLIGVRLVGVQSAALAFGCLVLWWCVFFFILCFLVVFLASFYAPRRIVATSLLAILVCLDLFLFFRL
jgi:hypothetical protein